MNISELRQNWDIIIIGGGVTGAGILREAVRSGIRVLLIEQKDFAWGTSSRSSKLVHGGLRYLKQGKFLLTRDSVVERERLIREAPGLVERLKFLMPIYGDYGPGKWLVKAGLSLYDLMAMKLDHRFYDRKEFLSDPCKAGFKPALLWDHRFYDREEFLSVSPYIRPKYLTGGFQFSDAGVDDARLVLRLIHDSMRLGASALNYTAVTEILRNHRGYVTGVHVKDSETQAERTLFSKTVINATGVWAETLHPSPVPNLHIRPLRGSHLIFPFRVLPAENAFLLTHPRDNRPVFVIPWEGATIFGTTDVDHKQELSLEPAITQAEVSYLTEALQTLFPCLNISETDCLSTMAGVRPVLSKGNNTDPSKESREAMVWADKGLVTITGGKLTTFRRLAWDALNAAKPFLSSVRLKGEGEAIFSGKESYDLMRSQAGAWEREKSDISDVIWRRLCGRYGNGVYEIVETSEPEAANHIPGTHTLWAELAYSAKHEQIRHLSDLLLRRVRIGLLTPQGGNDYLDRIRKLCEPALSWDNSRWEDEIKMYMKLWENAHALPK